MKTKQQILHLLEQNETLTLEHLSTLLSTPKSTIRARISELKKQSHPILSSYNPTRYTLFSKNPLLQYVLDNHLLSTPINLKNISISLSLPIQTIESHISSLFSNPNYHILQLTPNTIILSRNKPSQLE